MSQLQGVQLAVPELCSGHTHVAWCAADGGWDAVQVTLGEPKVCQLDDRVFLVTPKQNILQLDVPVGYTHAVAVVHSQNELLKDAPRLVLLQRGNR